MIELTEIVKKNALRKRKKRGIFIFYGGSLSYGMANNKGSFVCMYEYPVIPG